MKVICIHTLSGFLLATALGFSSAHAATFTNGPSDSSVCLDVAGGNPADGTGVQSFPCNTTFAQAWNLAGFSVLGLDGAAGKCLDVSGGGTADGTRVQLFQCNGTGAQQWSYFNGKVINQRSGKCLDVGNGAAATQATIRTCNGSTGQTWVIR
jgi:hypothetical protein